MQEEMIVHPIPPEHDGQASILILGSFPSVASRATAYFYGHPQNRFWRVLAAVMGDVIPQTVEEKRVFLHSHHIALWDVIASCRITGSADSSVKDVQANDLRPLLQSNPIRAIFVNGKTAEKYYNRLIYPRIGIQATCLPSTSPANAAVSLERLIEAWQVIKTEKSPI
jgi:hypoxanthine-DNA glycosylase